MLLGFWDFLMGGWGLIRRPVIYALSYRLPSVRKKQDNTVSVASLPDRCNGLLVEPGDTGKLFYRYVLLQLVPGGALVNIE
jgi:hypothetical protein